MKIETWPLHHSYVVVNFVLTLIFISYILRRTQKPPGSTLAWLFFVATIPYVGIPVYIFLSNRKFKNQPQNKDIDGLLRPKENRSIHLVSSEEEIYSNIEKLLESAKNTIYLSTFIFANDDVGKSLVKLLEKKAKEGVVVRVLLDSLGALWVNKPSFKEFKNCGGQIAQFMPLIHLPTKGRSNFRNHRKILSVDSEKVLLGGVNIAREYMGLYSNPSTWMDLCVVIEGASARDTEAIFRQDWKFVTGETLLIKGSGAEGNSSNNMAQIIPSGPDVKADALYDSLLTSIYGAKKKVWIATPYFIPDESLAKALELAGKRGVDVQILVPKNSNHFLADLARGTYLKQLSQSGCRINFYPRMMHAKAVLFDETNAVIGSANFDMRSLLLNYEIGVSLLSPAGISQVENWFRNSFSESSIANLRNGYWVDLAEGLGRVIGPLI